MMKIYDWILKTLQPVVEWIGSLHFPFAKKKITGDHYYLWRDRITPGTVLLSTTQGELSNYINPTKIKHGGLYVGGKDIKYVVEALGRGVVKNNLVKFMTTKDRIVIIRPKFASEEQIQSIIEHANKLLGMPYDYMFSKNNKALYCFEAIIEAYRAEFPEIPFKCKEIVKGKRIYDPDTFLEDPEHWEVILDSEGEYDGNIQQHPEA